MVAIVSGLALLVLNFRAFRESAAVAGHGPRAMLQMALIWALIFAGVTVGISLLGG